jgi:flagellar protein FlgJ
VDPIELNLNVFEQHRLGERSLAQRQEVGEPPEHDPNLHALKKTCRDFESVFVYTLLKTMRASLPKPEGDDTRKEMYTSMADLELARSIAHGRGIGLGDLLFEQLRQKVV